MKKFLFTTTGIFIVLLSTIVQANSTQNIITKPEAILTSETLLNDFAIRDKRVKRSIETITNFRAEKLSLFYVMLSWDYSGYEEVYFWISQQIKDQNNSIIKDWYLIKGTIDMNFFDNRSNNGFIPGYSYTYKVCASNGFYDDCSIFSEPYTVTFVNSPPILIEMNDQIIDEDENIYLHFMGTDSETMSIDLSYTATASNSSLLISENNYLTLESLTSSTHLLRLTPVSNIAGSSYIDITVTDEQGAYASNRFILTVDPVYEAPILSGFNTYVIAEDTSISIPFYVTDFDQLISESFYGDVKGYTDTSTITAEYSSITLIAKDNCFITGFDDPVNHQLITIPGEKYSLTLSITPIPNISGKTDITISAKDSHNLMVSENFQLIVLPVNDLPEIENINDQTSIADIPITIPSIGVKDIDSKILTIKYQLSRPELIKDIKIHSEAIEFNSNNNTYTIRSESDGISIATDIDIIITPIQDAFGSTDISICISDEYSSTTSTFKITLYPSVQDSPIQNEAIHVAAGSYHSISLKKDGSVWAWGDNRFGQLGDGTTINKNIPIQVLGLSNVTMIDSFCIHNLALKEDGSVWAWGYNGYGQLGDGSTTSRSSPVKVSGLSSVIMIAVGDDYSLALKEDGSVWAWGDNYYGQLGDVTTTNRIHPAQVNELSNVTMIAAGDQHCLALKDDGTVWAWGYNSFYNLGDGTTTDRNIPVQVPGLSHVTMIAAGYLHSLALKENGSVWSWGRNNYGQLGDGTITNRKNPVQISELFHVTMIAAGYNHSLALKEDGSVQAWGRNNYGQIGDGTTTDRNIPVQVNRLSHATLIAGGSTHSLALQNDGSVWAWGCNEDGQLGFGYPTYLPEPVFSDIQFVTKTMTTSQNNTISIPVINAAQKDMTFSYSTNYGTAIAGIDYLSASGTLTFLPNEVQKNIQITILNNPDSNSDKTFVLNLNASNDIFLNDASKIIITILSHHTVNSPYTETFSQNMPASGWAYDSSTVNGRIQQTSGCLRMDTDTDQVENLNEAILNIDLSYMDNLQLDFFQKSIANDICTSLPATYTDHFNGDGVSISNDGYTWYRIMDCTDLTTDVLGKNYTINLSLTESTIQSNYDKNFYLNQFVQIKFQQYGNRSYPSGGREWDNISINHQSINYDYVLKLVGDGYGTVNINSKSVLLPYSATVQADKEVCFEAVPDSDWQFINWTGDLISTANPACVILDQNKTITANMEIKTFVLSIQGSESITINNALYTLPFSKEFEIHTPIIIESDSELFKNWEGDIYSSNSFYAFTINSDLSIVASFYPVTDWKTIVHLERFSDYTTESQQTSEVIIGTAAQAYIKNASPPPAAYSCNMFVYVPPFSMFREDIRQNSIFEHEWNIALNPHGNCCYTSTIETAILSWDPLTFDPEGLYMLTSYSGEILVPDMRQISKYDITGDNSYNYFTISWQKPRTYDFHLKQGWNLISLPLIPSNTSISQLFPDYKYSFEFKNGTYYPVTSFIPGKGYWLKIPSDRTYTISGQPFLSHTIDVFHFDLSNGWHLIGGGYEEMIPENESIKVIFRYMNSDYEQSSTLMPGFGYWIKTGE